TGIMAGSLCPVELMKQVQEKMFMKVTSVYGLTETSPGMSQTRIDDSFDVRCKTVGSDYEFTEVKVLDPETGEECPVGVQGEMCCRGYNGMKGYYKNPTATAEVIDKDGFLHSGDLGIKDEDGNYRITGRIKDMIIRGGENIYPREIEEFLYKLDGVKDVQVAGIPSKKYGEEVGAFIILREGATLQESDVKDFCRNKISRYKIPKYIFFVNDFPLTGSGKIQKFKLKDLGLQLCQKRGIEVI
ncbi:propanoyl:CoA ligase, partial [termite gut metagenome]